MKLIEDNIKALDRADQGQADLVKLHEDDLETAAVSSMLITQLEQRVRKGRYQLRGKSDEGDAHMPSVRNIKEGVQESKRAVIPFYIDTY